MASREGTLAPPTAQQDARTARDGCLVTGAARDTAMSLGRDRVVAIWKDELAARPGGDYLLDIRRAGHPVPPAPRPADKPPE